MGVPGNWGSFLLFRGLSSEYMYMYHFFFFFFFGGGGGGNLQTEQSRETVTGQSDVIKKKLCIITVYMERCFEFHVIFG